MILISRWTAVVLAFLAVCTKESLLAQDRAPQQESAIYAVGTKTVFFRDPDKPFDPWGEKYKTEEYRQLLKRIAAAGDGRTVHAIIHYPAQVSKDDSFERGPLGLPRANRGELATADQFVPSMMGGRFTPTQRREAYLDAEPADGVFPIVLVLHGLGGGHGTFYKAAEFLASRGYIAVTVAFSSDSSSTPVFDDPESKYTKTRTDQQLRNDYRTMLPQGGQAVFGGFFRFMYGKEFRGENAPNPDTLKAVKGGGTKAAKMMAELFEMRTEDVGIVVNGLEDLNQSDPMLKGRIDTANIGVMGHSLGSITSQCALVKNPKVKTAIGFNNGLPRSWEPWGGFPNTSNGDQEKPDGVSRDILFIVGSDDNFVHMVFREIFLKWFEGAGGDLEGNNASANGAILANHRQSTTNRDGLL